MSQMRAKEYSQSVSPARTQRLALPKSRRPRWSVAKRYFSTQLIASRRTAMHEPLLWCLLSVRFEVL